MTEHGHPGWYSWLVVIGGCLTSILISIAVNQQTVQRERAERAEAEQRELERRAQSRATSCAFINKINGAYQSQINELSGPGLAIAAAWADLAKECP